MSTRNLVLLIIVLVILLAGAFGFFYLYRPATQTPAGESPNFVATLWPFGQSGTTTPGDTTPPADISGYTPPSPQNTVTAKLHRVSSMPIAGYGVFMKQRYGETIAETVPYIRYADRAMGNTYQTFADKIEERKFSVTNVPKLYEAYFGNGGESVTMRYLKEDSKTIETFAGVLPKEILGGDTGVENQLAGSFLPENISDVSISPDFSKIFYLLPSGDGTVGITAFASGEGKNQVFSSPFTEWLSQWPNQRMITLTTKPSGVALGYMYAVDPNQKDFNKILGGINGLTTLASPSGKLVLYADNNLSLKIFNIGTGETVRAGVKTLPEKCVWGSGSDTVYCAVPKYISSVIYPDSWYQGETSFSDEIWKIDVLNGNGVLLADPTTIENAYNIDGINLKLSEEEKYLFLVNKNDSYLWELEL